MWFVNKEKGPIGRTRSTMAQGMDIVTSCTNSTKLLKVEHSCINFCKAVQNYTKLHTSNQKLHKLSKFAQSKGKVAQCKFA